MWEENDTELITLSEKRDWTVSWTVRKSTLYDTKSEPPSFITLNRLCSLECKVYGRTFGYSYLSSPKFFVISSIRSIHGTSLS